jgi:hypothetical protein
MDLMDVWILSFMDLLDIWILAYSQPYNSTCLTLILLTWKIWRASNNVNKWQMGFNSVFKGLRRLDLCPISGRKLRNRTCCDGSSTESQSTYLVTQLALSTEPTSGGFSFTLCLKTEKSTSLRLDYFYPETMHIIQNISLLTRPSPEDLKRE